MGVSDDVKYLESERKKIWEELIQLQKQLEEIPKIKEQIKQQTPENPGKLIYDYNNADHPLMDALDKSIKLRDAITKIANIPGMSKLSNILVEKDKKIKEEIADKIDEGIEASKAIS